MRLDDEAENEIVSCSQIRVWSLERLGKQAYNPSRHSAIFNVLREAPQH